MPLNEFDHLKRAVEELKRVNRRRNSKGRPRSERRAEARRKLLPKNRIYPVCKNIITESRGWVLKHEDGPMCRSCYFKRLV